MDVAQGLQTSGLGWWKGRSLGSIGAVLARRTRHRPQQSDRAVDKGGGDGPVGLVLRLGPRGGGDSAGPAERVG